VRDVIIEDHRDRLADGKENEIREYRKNDRPKHRTRCCASASGKVSAQGAYQRPGYDASEVHNCDGRHPRMARRRKDSGFGTKLFNRHEKNHSEE
jgi:hypothetical protein